MGQEKIISNCELRILKKQAGGSKQRTDDRNSYVGAAFPDLSLSKVSRDQVIS